ncbi:ubiquitin family protein [Thalictrum thalictroides]|uniref:Ubiquitin family protein n=1 Tax=Thalictrum thalictroides TaxID=46969 RepID=A0A7J6WMF3_THATH|nr:ubiquitin family protein [Thalictrum thalictroides]
MYCVPRNETWKLEQPKRLAITLKTIGPTRPTSLKVPSSINVRDLRSLIAGFSQLPGERLKLILRGEVLHDTKSGDDVHLRLKDRDSVIVAVKPKSPARHIRNGFDDEDDEDDLKFQIPQSTSRWKRKLFTFLHDKVKLPYILLTAIFSISLKAWAFIILWFMLAPVAYRWHLGPLYILGTGFSIILLNLGKREDGELSAYSVFNEDFRELPGTLNADRLDRDIRAGQF